MALPAGGSALFYRGFLIGLNFSFKFVDAHNQQRMCRLKEQHA
jgi:hypothetical protein